MSARRAVPVTTRNRAVSLPQGRSKSPPRRGGANREAKGLPNVYQTVCRGVYIYVLSDSARSRLEREPNSMIQDLQVPTINTNFKIQDPQDPTTFPATRDPSSKRSSDILLFQDPRFTRSVSILFGQDLRCTGSIATFPTQDPRSTGSTGNVFRF